MTTIARAAVPIPLGINTLNSLVVAAELLSDHTDMVLNLEDMKSSRQMRLNHITPFMQSDWPA